MEVMQQFTRRVFWTSVLIILFCGAGAAVFSLALAKGLLLGGISACLVFLLWARMASRILSCNQPGASAMIPWPFVRFMIYSLVLWRAHSFDPVGWRGFWGAVAGLSVVYIVTAIIGHRGRDLQEVPK
jgi:hypothetical protein